VGAGDIAPRIHNRGCILKWSASHFGRFLPRVMMSPGILNRGRAIAHAVSRRLPNAAACVQVQVRSSDICGGQSGTGAGFLRVLWFPLPILTPPTAPHS
jgi:hypothetical protein